MTHQDISEKVVSYWEKMGRLNLLTGVAASQQMRWDQKQARKNREAEESHVRKVAWGSDETGDGEEMGDNIYLGDVTVGQPQLNKPSGIAKALAATGIAAAGIGTGLSVPVAVWQYMQSDKQVTQPVEDDEYGYEISIFRDDDE